MSKGALLPTNLLRMFYVDSCTLASKLYPTSRMDVTYLHYLILCLAVLKIRSQNIKDTLETQMCIVEMR